MSHHHDTEPKTCPNCNFPATHNYCAQCGQETHLHKDTFFGLIWHFIGHYFHYDSKFWKTLKKLWFAPGKLTVEYHEGKRARSIPPISLYIFVSAVYFLIAFLLPAGEEADSRVRISTADTTIRAAAAPSLSDSTARAREARPLRRASSEMSSISRKIERLEKDDAAAETFLHQVPKVFFFMIPFTAFLLWLLFLRRKAAPFAYHAVFSLHVHSFFFSLSLVDAIIPFDALSSTAENIVLGILALTFSAYFVLAMRNAYKISYFRAILNTLVVGFIYVLVIFVIIVGLLIRLADKYGTGELSL